MRQDLTIEHETIALSCYKCGTALVFSKYDNLAESTCAKCFTPLFLPHEVEWIPSRQSKPNIFLEKASRWFLWRVLLSNLAGDCRQILRKLMRWPGNRKGTRRKTSTNGSNTLDRRSNVDAIRKSIRSRLDEVYADLEEISDDLQEARHEASQARKDRIQEIKRSLEGLLEQTYRIEGLRLAVRDLLEAAERVDME